MTTKKLLCGVAALMLSLAATAGEAVKPGPTGKSAKPPVVAASNEEKAVLANLKKLYPATKFASVTKTPMKGVFEVVMGPNVAYVTNDARHFLFGHMFDMQRQVDLTEQRKVQGPDNLATYEPPAPGEATVVKVADLPLKDAIKRVTGSGARTLFVFADPLCGYCKRLEADLANVENTTVYTFLIPILGPNSRKAAEAMWAEAMPERASETAVIDRNLKLSQRFGINGTPALIRGDGQVVSGALPAHELSRWLDDAPKTAQLTDKANPPEAQQ